jgi:hypothetical protein
LLSNVKAMCSIGVVISTSEKLPQDRVVRLLHTFGLDVPTGKVVLQYAYESLFWIFHLLGSGSWQSEGYTGYSLERHLPEDQVRVRHKVGDSL